MTNINLLRALSLKYEGDIASAKANIEVYLNNSVGIGEHGDLVSTIDSEIAKLCDATDKLDVLIPILDENAPTPTKEWAPKPTP